MEVIRKYKKGVLSRDQIVCEVSQLQVTFSALRSARKLWCRGTTSGARIYFFAALVHRFLQIGEVSFPRRGIWMFTAAAGMPGLDPNVDLFEPWKSVEPKRDSGQPMAFMMDRWALLFNKGRTILAWFAYSMFLHERSQKQLVGKDLLYWKHVCFGSLYSGLFWWGATRSGGNLHSSERNVNCHHS